MWLSTVTIDRPTTFISSRNKTYAREPKYLQETPVTSKACHNALIFTCFN